MDLVAAAPLQLVGIERLTERLLADERPVGQFLLAHLEPRQHLVSPSALSGPPKPRETLNRAARVVGQIGIVAPVESPFSTPPRHDDALPSHTDSALPPHRYRNPS